MTMEPSKDRYRYDTADLLPPAEIRCQSCGDSRNFMVPIPHAASFAELNARLLECCR
jgi:hypothetical protein